MHPGECLESAPGFISHQNLKLQGLICDACTGTQCLTVDYSWGQHKRLVDIGSKAVVPVMPCMRQCFTHALHYMLKQCHKHQAAAPGPHNAVPSMTPDRAQIKEELQTASQPAIPDFEHLQVHMGAFWPGSCMLSHMCRECW